MTTTEKLELARTAATLIAALVAIWGINTWRRQLVGTKRYELAEQTLALFYEAQEVIREMRVGVVDKNELSGFSKPEPTETENPMVAWFNAMDAERRALFAKLEALKFRFMATFGSEYGRAFEIFASVNGKVRHAAMRLPEFDQNRMSEGAWKAYKRWDEIRYYTGETDEIEKELSAALAPVEQLCRDVVGAKTPWERWREWTKPPDS